MSVSDKVLLYYLLQLSCIALLLHRAQTTDEGRRDNGAVLTNRLLCDNPT